VGSAIGLGIGLFLGWVQFPVITVDSQLRTLSSADRDRYAVMVAEAYALDGDPQAAIDRLRPLGAANIPAYVRDLTERYISDTGTGNQRDIRYLVQLSRALGYFTPPMQAFAVETSTPAPGGR
jgi:hypothetical protein